MTAKDRRRTSGPLNSMRRRLFLQACVVFVCACVLGSTSLVSDASARERRAKPRAKQVQTVSESVHKQLLRAQELIGEDQISEALVGLRKLEAKKDKLNSYERALMYQTIGYAYSTQGDYVKAASSFEKCLKEKSLPEAAQLSLRFNLGQLYVANGEYKKGIAALEQWFTEVKSPGASAYFTLATAYAQQENFAKAIKLGEQGLAQGEDPRENWLNLMFSCYYYTKDYKNAAKMGEKLVERFAKKSYIMQLAAMYGSLGRDRDSMALQEMAYERGYLTSDSELRRMAETFLYNDAPYKAALVIEKGLSQGKIKENEKAWYLLGSSWVQAKEFKKAEIPLLKAAELSEKGQTFAMIGQVAMEEEDWKLARKYFRKALRKGELKSKAQVNLLLGVCLFHLKEYEQARTAFLAAARNEKTEKAARQWLKHLRAVNS